MAGSVKGLRANEDRAAKEGEEREEEARGERTCTLDEVRAAEGLA